MAYNKLKVRVGIFVFILLLNFIAAIVYILVEKGIFEKGIVITLHHIVQNLL